MDRRQFQTPIFTPVPSDGSPILNRGERLGCRKFWRNHPQTEFGKLTGGHDARSGGRPVPSPVRCAGRVAAPDRSRRDTHAPGATTGGVGWAAVRLSRVRSAPVARQRAVRSGGRLQQGGAVARPLMLSSTESGIVGSGGRLSDGPVACGGWSGSVSQRP